MRRSLFPAVLTYLCISPSFGAARYVDAGAPGPVHDGSSWATAFLTVQSALAAANAGDEVWVAKGVYAGLVRMPTGVSLYGGFSGTETERGQRDWKANATVLDGGGLGRIVWCLVDGIVVDGFTIRNAGFGDDGYGVYFASATSTLSNCIVSGNLCGVYISGPGAATLTNNIVSGNDYGVISTSRATLTNNTICSNGNAGLWLTYNQQALASNNLIAFNGGHGVFLGPYGRLTPSHNNVYGNARGNYWVFPDPTGTEGNISEDPKLSSIYRDFHLQPGSPCVDAGSDAASLGSTDIDGQPRIHGARVDIGADESDGTTWNISSLVRHVAPTGDDGNDGLTWATAKRTVGGVLAVSNGADEVWVAGGTYAERITVTTGVRLYGGFAGTEAERDQRDWRAHETVLEGGGMGTVVTARPFGFVLDGFTIRNAGTRPISSSRYGVCLASGTATLSNNTVSGNVTGVWANTVGAVTLINNAVSDNTGVGVSVNTNGQSPYNPVNGTAKLIRNQIRRNGGGVYIVWSDAARLVNNAVSENTGDGAVVYASSTALVSNLVSGNTGSGVRVEGLVPADGRYDGALLTNNTLSGNGSAGVDIITGPSKLANNIVAFNGLGVHSLFVDTPIPTLAHNDVYGNSSGNYPGLADPTGTNGNISGDPLFVDRAGGDHRLAAGSPCIDAGDGSVVTPGETDMDGKPRILGPSVDIGAYEYETSASPFSLADAIRCMDISGGLSSAAPEEVSRLKLEASALALNLLDAIRIVRTWAGLEPNR